MENLKNKPRLSNKEIKMDGLKMKYFVLKPTGDNPYSVASRQAMYSYARSIASENPSLAKELREWADTEAIKQCPSLMSD